jgi:type III secretory pathway lipoprotein EscJ
MHHSRGDDSRRSAPRVTPAQIVGIGLVAASLGWAAWLLRDRPISEEVELLPGTVLPSSEMAIVEAAFDRAQLIDHRTEDGRVWVPRPRQSAYMRALVDAEALPREFGSSLRRALERNSPWQSRAVQEEMLRVAVQEELAHVICSMPGIERAAVLSDVEARSAGGLGGPPQRTASVNIRTQAGVELEPARVEAIRVLVAASIAGLEAEQVAVTDLRSGRVFAGPVTAADPAAELATVDPNLARRIAHERHLATKLRQALAYVKGAIVEVTVSFPAPAPPRLPPAEPLTGGQRVADANAPAAVAVPLPAAPPEPEATDLPASILVSLAVPDDFFAGLDADAASALEAGLREHVVSLAGPTARPDATRLVLTRFPTARVGGRPNPRPVGSSPGAPAGERATSDVAVSLEAAWKALLAGRTSQVPREIWLAVIAVAAGLMGLLVLRPRRIEPQPRRARRHSTDRIDWSSVGSDEDHPDDHLQAAA